MSALAPVDAAGPDANGWMPIETAPKDGTWFLICRDEDGEESYEVGRYSPLLWDDYVDNGDGFFRKERKSIYDWRGFNNMHRATHWRPLPNPPVSHLPSGAAACAADSPARSTSSPISSGNNSHAKPLAEQDSTVGPAPSEQVGASITMKHQDIRA